MAFCAPDAEHFQSNQSAFFAPCPPWQRIMEQSLRQSLPFSIHFASSRLFLCISPIQNGQSDLKIARWKRIGCVPVGEVSRSVHSFEQKSLDVQILPFHLLRGEKNRPRDQGKFAAAPYAAENCIWGAATERAEKKYHFRTSSIEFHTFN